MLVTKNRYNDVINVINGPKYSEKLYLNKALWKISRDKINVPFYFQDFHEQDPVLYFLSRNK